MIDCASRTGKLHDESVQRNLPAGFASLLDLPIRTGEGSSLYTENCAKDVVLFAKAVLSNQLARFAPAAYIQLTRHTGRGEEEQTPAQIADYFIQCCHDYRKQLKLDELEFASFLSGKRVLEYGPGDILGVALLMYAHGAEAVHCFDRFPLTARRTRIYRSTRSCLARRARTRAGRCGVRRTRQAGQRIRSVVHWLLRFRTACPARPAGTTS